MNSDYVQNRSQLLLDYDRIPEMSLSSYQSFILNLFRFQHKYNDIYNQYCKNLGLIDISDITLDSIPFLPISAFKHHAVKTGIFEAQQIFTSSGTTSLNPSRHHVKDKAFYHTNAEKIWKIHFDDIQNYCFLALLPGYLDRSGSSLISMMEYFISKSVYKESGFYLRDYDKLFQSLQQCKINKIPVVLLGVAYALIDFAEQFPMPYEELLIIETGGMKGNRKEMTKTALHQLLSDQFQTNRIYSEYGMTELLSQAYTSKDQIFNTNPYLSITVKQLNDPLSNEKTGKPGIFCVTDLANIDSCAFIQTEDMGIRYADGSFEISGRVDAAEWRGCNLLLHELQLT